MVTPYVLECKNEHSAQKAYSPVGRKVYKQIIPSQRGRCTDGGVCSQVFGNQKSC